MHDINNNKAPVNMSNLFRNTSNIHSYNTRSSMSGKFYVKSSRLEIQNISFPPLGVKQWNKITSSITNLPKKAFKRVLRKLLFDILEMEGDYIEIPLIIKKTRVLNTLVKVLISAFLVFLSCHYALFFSKRCINLT